jgi:hypothetical protein
MGVGVRFVGGKKLFLRGVGVGFVRGKKLMYVMGRPWPSG